MKQLINNNISKEPDIKLVYGGHVDIATTHSRNAAVYKNKKIEVLDLYKKFSNTTYTQETCREYKALKKAEQDQIKDRGGFVGGYLVKGKRKKDSVMHRQLLTLDVDFANTDFWADFTMLYDCSAALYSTHKHSPETPRFRLVIPLDSPVAVDQYEAIIRRIAETLGIDLFDHTTFEHERLMYWPSTSKDGVFVFEYQDGPWLSAENILSTYVDYREVSEWPETANEKLVPKTLLKKAEDPRTKPRIIGAFCRTYDIHEAIELFLSDVYDPCTDGIRYTYREGSTGGGLVTHDDVHAYSFHGTDPVSGKLCNAFDLVRIHKFGLKDTAAKEDTPVNKLPSFLAMTEWVLQDEKVKLRILTEKLESINDDFGGADVCDTDASDDNALNKPESETVCNKWMAGMDVDGKGNCLSTRKNFKLVLENDPHLKKAFAYDVFSKRKIVIKDLPWRKVTRDTCLLMDEDENDLRIYLADKPFELSHNSNLKDVFDSVIIKQTIHPVKDFLESCVWDGAKRVETLFIDYMGAEDSAYTRAVTRKALTAAAARIFEPGIKFDHVLTLIGEEGKLKSSILRKIARDWFSDTFSFKMLERGKEAFEQLQGYWIIEIAELSGIRKAEAESIKQFITKNEDVYRIPHKAYTSQFKRQCVFFGSTNKWDFLSSADGNRRFWPVPIYVNTPAKDVSKDLTDDEVKQIWAEAVTLYKAKETLYLSKEIEDTAREMQRGHTEKDDRAGAIEKYLEILLPENWEELAMSEKYSFITGDLSPIGTVKRNKVCVAEIWSELFGGSTRDLNSYNTKSLHAVLQTMRGWKRSTMRRFKDYGRQVSYVRVGAAIDGLSVNADGSLAIKEHVNAETSIDSSIDSSIDT